MAGGAGTRFWPMSTEEKPKQFIDVLHQGRTLLQMTYDRALSMVSPDQIWVMTHAKYHHLVRSQLPDLPESNIMLEPQRKNTAPAIAYAAYKLKSVDEQAIMVVLSSDHVIMKDKSFINCIEEGVLHVSQNDSIVTLGIKPTEPHTGYGYIQFEDSDSTAKRVLRFVEKPNATTAVTYLRSGDYLWNAGIFIWSIEKVIHELTMHAGDICDIFRAFSASIGSSNESKALMIAFDQCRSESIDYAIMEKADRIYTIPADIGWSDLGTWGSLYSMTKDGEAKNSLSFGPQVVIEDICHSVIRLPQDKKAIIKGLDGYVVAWEEDGLLIYPIKEEQQIKQSLQKLK